MRSEDKILTVAVPAYNAAQYLDKCITSLISGGVNHLDIIIVNDGSTDNTKQIAEKYACEYPNSIRVINKENGGHGSGINTAIKLAAGRYFRVLDADDWVLSQYMGAYLSALNNCNADIALTHYHNVDMKTGRRTPHINTGCEFNKEYTPENFAGGSENAAKILCMHAIAYNTEFYRNIDFNLTEKVFYEDLEYSAVPFVRCKSIVLFDIPIYEYMVGNASQSVSVQSYIKRHAHLKIVLTRLIDEYALTDAAKSAQRAFLAIRIKMLLATYEKVALTYLKDKKYGRVLVKAIRKEIAQTDANLLSNTGLRHNAFLLCNFMNISPYWIERQYAKFKRRPGV